MGSTKPNKNCKILIVDDDPISCLLHKNLFRRSEVEQEVLSFPNGKRAVDFLETVPEGEHTLVFLDLNMPVMNGWEFLEELRKKGYPPIIHVVIVSSSTYNADLIKALKYPMVIGFCQKPFTLENIKKITALKEVKRFF